jgi:THO complex subunit 7
MASLEAACQERLKSKESVILGHSLKKVSQKCVQLFQEVQSGADKAAKSATCSSALCDLGLYKNEIEKAEQVALSCKDQIEDYVHLEAEVSSMVESTQREIEKLNEELSLAKKVRQHKEQYEALAKIVNQHPSKSNTINEQDKVKAEISKLEDEKNDLDKQINTREKQFTLLMSTIDDLTRTLKDDPFEKDTSTSARKEDGGGKERNQEDNEDENDDEEDDSDKIISPREKRVRREMEEGEEEDEEVEVEDRFKRSKSASSIASASSS